jgi:hypothetical protein
MNIKKYLYDGMIIICITIATLAVLEVALRIIFPDLKRTRSTLESMAYQYNKDYLVSLKPNTVKEYEIKKGEVDFGKTITWKTNSLGFRGDEVGQKRGLRVIVYGDSNIQARFSEAEYTYTSALQKLLRANYANADVINAGIVGAGPDESLIRLSNDFDKVNPDIVIFHVFADNDYGDIIRNRLFKFSPNNTFIKTKYPITVDERFTSRESTIVELVHKLYIQRIINRLIHEARDYKQNNLSHEEKVEQILNDLEKRAASAYKIYKEDKPRHISHFEDYYDIDVAAHPDSESARIKIALMEEVLVAASEFCAKNNISFIILVQPAVFDLALNVNLDVGNLDLAKRYENYKPENLSDPLKEICTKHGFNCIHLINSFRQNNPASVYRNDGHWNTKGQMLAAEETKSAIIRLQIPQPIQSDNDNQKQIFQPL